MPEYVICWGAGRGGKTVIATLTATTCLTTPPPPPHRQTEVQVQTYNPTLLPTPPPPHTPNFADSDAYKPALVYRPVLVPICCDTLSFSYVWVPTRNLPLDTLRLVQTPPPGRGSSGLGPRASPQEQKATAHAARRGGVKTVNTISQDPASLPPLPPPNPHTTHFVSCRPTPWQG